MSEPKTYSLENLSELFSFNKNYIKMILRKMNIDSSLPVEEEDVVSLAKMLKRPWPPKGGK
jgi:hypothetical protein